MAGSVWSKGKPNGCLVRPAARDNRFRRASEWSARERHEGDRGRPSSSSDRARSQASFHDASLVPAQNAREGGLSLAGVHVPPWEKKKSNQNKHTITAASHLGRTDTRGAPPGPRLGSRPAAASRDDASPSKPARACPSCSTRLWCLRGPHHPSGAAGMGVTELELVPYEGSLLRI